VRELTLRHTTANTVTAIGRSVDLPRLDDLTLLPDRSNADWPVEQYRGFAESSLAERVKWLRVVVGTDAEAEALAGPHLANLRGLDVEGVLVTEDYLDNTRRVAGAVGGLLSSRYLVNLKELTLTGGAVLVFSRITDDVAKGLKRLQLEAPNLDEGFTGLLRRDGLSNLTDLSITLSIYPAKVYFSWLCTALANSPLAGRLRHLRLTGSWAPGSVSAGEVLRLIRALNPETMETLVLDRIAQEAPEVWAELQTRFPGKVRLL
jgi:hypothetical protein